MFGAGWLTRTFVLVWTLAPLGCIPNEPPKIELSPVTHVPVKLGMVLWVDGVGADTLEAMAAKGELPNISKYLIARGVTVGSAVASIPTITYPNNISFITGVLPGHHGITGNSWFDRNRLVFQNYSFVKSYLMVNRDFGYKTIYEMLNQDFSSTILTPAHRGATEPFNNMISAGTAWFLGYQDTISHLTTLRFNDISALANRSGRWPEYIFAYFSSPDTVNHHKGQGQEYRDIIIDFDQQVGHICQSLEKAGLLDRTYISLISDHGITGSRQHLDMGEYFETKLGIPTSSDDFGYVHSFDARLKHFQDARAVVCVNGDRQVAIHLRPGEHWWVRPTLAETEGFTKFCSDAWLKSPPSQSLPQVLAALPATDLVVVRVDENNLRILNTGGTAELTRGRTDGGNVYRYRAMQGVDPLGYKADHRTAGLMDGQFHDAQQWLDASAGGERPDVVAQLLELNDSPRAGDILLFAKDGWDYGHEDLGGHGGLTRRELIVPWIIAGPGLPRGGHIEGARSVDLVPTMMDLLGRADSIPPGLDGRSIADRLRTASK